MTQHTKGPWYIKGTNPPYIYANDAMEIICQCDSIKEMTKDQEMANARLIAAAPELLEALEKALDFEDADYMPNNWFNIARTAIDKAKGK